MAIEDISNKQNNGRGDRIIVLVVLTVMAVMLGAITINKNQSFKKSAMKTEGYLSYGIVKGVHGDYYDIYAIYTVDGKQYSERVGSAPLSDDLAYEERIPKTIYYNPDNPKECRIDIDSSVSNGMIIIGTIVMICILYLYTAMLKRRSMNVDGTTIETGAKENTKEGEIL